MRRRDTIIIAVLVNAALLLVLFATAMRSDNKKAKDESLAQTKEHKETKESEPIASAIPADDVVMEILGGEEVDLSSLDNAPQDLMAPVPLAQNPTSNSATTTSPTVASTGTPIAKHSTTPSGATGAQPQTLTSLPPSTPLVANPVQSPISGAKNVVEVKVKKGDALEKIARAHKTTVAEIMRESNISSTNLKIGQMLKVPSNGQSVGSSQPVAVATAPLSKSTDDFYTVKEGDNPWLIATRLGMKVDDLLRLNGIDDVKAKKLRPGDRLKVR